MDAWLSAEVEPLAPPPGTFERVRRRARRRKAGRAMMSAAGIVIVIAAAVAVPRIGSTLLHSHNGPRRAVAAAPPPSPRKSPTARGNESPNVTAPTRMAPPMSSLSPGGTSGYGVPQNVQPTSVTFVSQSAGAVIGQAGTPGHCPIVAADCTSLAGTSDYGRTWYGVSAPVTGAPDGSSGVSQLRFLNARDGWAFGPDLYVTHDGGAHWLHEDTGGMRVTSLETAGARAFAFFASCTGTGPDYGAHCTSFSLYSSPAQGDQWQTVPVPAASMQRPGTGAGQPGSASLVLVGGFGGTGYVLVPSGELLSGPLTGSGWSVASQQVPCRPGAPGADGQPTGALLAANANRLVLVCTSATSAASDTQAKSVFASTDGGARWSPAGSGLPNGIATSVAIQAQGNLVVLATDLGLYRSGDGGRTWHQVQPSPGRAAAGKSGFSYVGMTSPANGVALPADARLGEIFITTDGGISWLTRPVS
jgi:hypothetical protein